VKLNEFKESKLNEIDLSSFLGDYGSAAVRSGVGSMMGKNVLSTADQMAKDEFVKTFTSRANSGLQSAINSGLVDVNAAGKGAATTAQSTTQPQAQQGAQTTPANAIAQKRIDAQKLAQQRADAEGKPISTAPNRAAPNPAQIRQQKQQAAAQSAQQQMAPVSKLPANQFAKSAANVRQAQQGQAATAAQGQMTPKVAGPTPKTPEQIRQAKQLAATQAAQGQMNPASKLPADQFNKSADNVRQQQQATATQTAQGQMAAPKQVDPRFPNVKYDGVTGEPTPEWQKELDKQEAAREVEYQANLQKSKAAAAERDAQNAELVRQGLRQNPSNVTNNVTQTTTAPDNVKITNGDPAEIQAKMQAKIDAMKEKNPKLAAAMQAEIDSQFKQDKPDNTIQMPNRSGKPRNSGKKAFNQMAQDLGKVAESRFAKLNYIFESILAEQDPAQGATKQTISQYITNFFKQFMKNVDISDPTVMTNVASLAKELEQNYAKDKGKTTLPKLANLAYSVSHAQQLKDPEQAQTTKSAQPTPATTAPQSSTPQTTQASTQQANMTVAQIKKLMQGMNTKQKQSILTALQSELSKDTPPNVSVGRQKNNKKAMDPSDARLLAVAKQQGKI
jgi:broad specificity phosphatase PhoE